MRETHIPYGTYWSTPFARWQGSFSHLHPLEFAAHVTKSELKRRNIDPKTFDFGILGTTIPAPGSFFGLPWITGLIGAASVGGPTVNQACATSARCLQMASQEVGEGDSDCALVIAADKCSNGPHLYYPNPGGTGGTGVHEDWVLDNFNSDPYARCAMITTAENVAKKFGVKTAEQHDVKLRRYEQYQEACAGDHAFHRRYMVLPFEIPDPKFRKTVKTLTGDEGIHPTTAEGLAGLKPVLPDGTVTFGAQTHPADGNAAIVLASPGRARELSKDPKIRVRLLGFGQSRAALAYMPEAPIPAAQKALAQAGLGFGDLQAIKTHNPFAVNDVLFARTTGVPIDRVNNYGCSLVWGHPQAPMGTRGVIELIEELALRGGGRGLFTGCAAGDTAMAVVLEVTGA